MFALLPLLCFILLFVILSIKLSNNDETAVRFSFISAAVIWGLLVVIFTEALSFNDALYFNWVVSLWAVCDIGLACVLYFTLKNNPLGTILKKSLLSKTQIVLLSVMAIFILVEAVIAVSTPPNVHDSMVYHMTRVAHWVQNHNVDFYATSDERQNALTPWAEFAILHLYILCDGDRLANLIQLFSMIGSIVGVSLIAKELGADTSVQLITSVMCLTIPMGILQAMTTQNDYAVSFWLVCFVFFTLRFKKELCWANAIAAGVSLGLALLTKGTAYLFAFPFLVWLTGSSLITHRSKAIKYLFVIATAVLAINFSHYIRNFNLYGNPLSPTYMHEMLKNNQITLPILVSNIVRNVGLHLATPSAQLNKSVEGWIHQLLGSEINNPASTFLGHPFSITFSIDPCKTGNQLHLLFIFISLLTVVFYKPLRNNKNLFVYTLSLVIGYLFFCGYLKWQPWHSRLQLPFFILAAPLIGIASSHISSRRMMSFIFFIFMISSIPIIVLNQSNPIIGPKSILKTNRTTQYFNELIDYKTPYIKAAELISKMGISNLGIVMGGDCPEYLLWVLLKDKYKKLPHIEHVNSSSISKKYFPVHFFPQAIFSTKETQKIIFSGIDYIRIWHNGNIGVFINSAIKTDRLRNSIFSGG